MTKSVIFVLPKDSKRTLTESGWLFHSNMKIPNLVQTKLVHFLNLDFKEEFVGIKKYENGYTQMNIVFTNKKITEIYLRTSLQKDMFINQLLDLLKHDEVEVFAPDNINNEPA